MKKTNKTTLMLFALVLSLSVTVGATLAYFSDYEQASGGATLNLGGKTELTEGSDEDEKNVKIKNTGETNMIVRVGIYGPDEMDDPYVDTTKWIVGADGIYYYYKVLLPDEDTGGDNLVASMSFDWQLGPGEEPPDYYFEVTVVHEGAQAIYDDNNKLIPPTDPGSSQPYWDAEAVSHIQPPAVQQSGN